MDPLKSNTKVRLARYRAKAQKYPTPDGWRHWRYPIFVNANNVRGKEGQIFSESTDQYGDYLGDAHDLAPRAINHTGWYADSYQEARVVGGVAKLRSARYTLYVPVTHCAGWAGTVHYLNDAVLVERGSSQDEHDDAIHQLSLIHI